MKYSIRTLTDEDALTVGSWHYDSPWSIYELSEPTALVGIDGYYAVAEWETGELVGFVCLGEEARVPGFFEESGVIVVSRRWI